MKDPQNHTPQSSSSTHSKLPVGIALKSSSLTHPWWIYQANQMKIRNNNGAEVLAQIYSFSDEPPTDSEDGR
jgi:viroplasmin and RNaseH domain-containing protein